MVYETSPEYKYFIRQNRKKHEVLEKLQETERRLNQLDLTNTTDSQPSQ